MRAGLICLAVLILPACSGEEETSAPPAAQPSPAPPTASAPAAPPAPSAKARLVEETNDFLEFTYGWPAEAAAIPQLAQRFEADLAAQRKEALAAAREDKEARGADAPYNAHSFRKVWSAEGQSQRLLSLVAEVYSFTGGAHGNTSYEALLWDYQTDKPLRAAALFNDPKSAFQAMTPVYCKALDRQRLEKRQGQDLSAAGDWMTDCPALAEQTLVPVDANKDGRFELFRVLIGPYGAGPYVEGTYEIDLPATDAVKRLIKPDYAGAF